MNACMEQGSAHNTNTLTVPIARVGRTEGSAMFNWPAIDRPVRRHSLDEFLTK